MNLQELEKLIKLVERSEISELEITRFGQKVRISKNLNFKQSKMEGIDPATVEVKLKAAQVEEKRLEERKVEERPKNAVTIKSPIVGTFYRAPAPDAPPYVEVGDIVKPGQVVCLVEAMKLMNEIESEIAGKILSLIHI